MFSNAAPVFPGKKRRSLIFIKAQKKGVGDGLLTFPREESINVVATDSQIREITSVQVKLGFLNT